ncbi:sucrase ferredoxin [Corynebacterium gallinarum]|uniref:Sucrase ferredoxin n=1 Tax=Corynebacterium gallinarum TaxID=2762214 RepID=A0A8I0HQ27_9CORY|nr:sucrase ferredoxin [Corynebacterium gallinarum]MBD8029445.1 sucrase ferredoxin [Corynebacterium gallinarum]
MMGVDSLTSVSTTGSTSGSPLRCSDVGVEPLPGTAKTGQGFVLLEHPGPWSRDVLDGGTFTPELTTRLEAHLKAAKMGLQLIRKPGREGRQIDGHTVFLVFSDQAVTERLVIDDPAGVLDLDLSGPGRNGAGLGTQRVDHPVLLICTHAKRDACCAIKGRPLAAELVAQFPSGFVWESSHTKGHRFAPSMLLMPWNYSFGRLNAESTAALLTTAQRGEYFHPGNRGRGTLDARGQVAELAVAEQLIGNGETVGLGQLEVDAQPGTVVVTHPDGRIFEVELDQRTIEGVISSCGDEPKVGKGWVATVVRQRP